MRKFLPAGITAACIAVLIATLHAQPITVISFGPAVTVLNTSSTGAVNGSTFALPGTNANVLTWQVTADGSALSASLQVSLDGTNWNTLSTCTTAAGCIYNAGVNAYVFVRVIQTSRTGGTATTSTINTDRAYSITNGTSPVLSGNLLFSPDSTYNIGAASNSGPNQIWANLLGLRSGGSAAAYMQGSGGGSITLFNSGGTDFNLLRFGGGTSVFPALKRNTNFIEVRLADDSARTGITGTYYNATGTILQSSSVFASLGTPSNGTFLYCSDCTIANPCAGAGTGAFAKRLNGAWVCN